MDDQIKSKIKSLDYEAAITFLTDYIAAHPDDDEAYTMRGMRYWGAMKRSLAINDYLSAVRINPDSRAAQALKAANEVLDYRNKDLYNP